MTDNNMEPAPGTPTALEQRMDALLSDFFRSEVPASLGHGALNWGGVDEGTQRPAAAQAGEMARPSQSWQRRTAAAIGIVTVAACCLLIVNPFGSEPAAERTIAEPTVSTGEEMMLVSPGAEQHDADATVVGDHGLTIGETDAVDLSPSGSRQ